MDITNWKYQDYWSLSKDHPRPEQIRIINEIIEALEMGFKNIIVEAGTGTGKSAIATTIANFVNSSYICTMTNQLQAQYLEDFKHMLTEIKGRSNYRCNYNETCENCYIKYINQNNITSAKLNILADTNFDLEYVESLGEDEQYLFLSKIKVFPCKNCRYLKAFKAAINSPNIITNYDYLYNAGVYGKLLTPRSLIILDESHNLEKKVMNMISETLNRRKIIRDYAFDIFYPVTQGKTLKSINSNEYWIGVCNHIIDIIKKEKQDFITKNTKLGLSEEDIDTSQFSKKINNYTKLIKHLENDWIVELPKKEDILKDTDFNKKLKVKFKPLTVEDYTKPILDLGVIRLFLTGTLGSHDKFCEWIGIDPKETYYIYVKSPFPVSNRPIIKSYVGNMAGKTNGKYNWEILFDKSISKVKEIIKKHAGEKGVIHTSSNKQSFMIKKALGNTIKSYIAQGKERNKWINKFEQSTGPCLLIGAGIKDGVDFKYEKCRFQILFKMPNLYVGSVQVQKRKYYDKTWYAYQTVMPLMQSYGRGIRDVTDYCTTYVLDSDFERLLREYKYLFNEYFLEAIKGNNGPRPIPKPIRVNGG